jgi:hypothetical protein
MVFEHVWPSFCYQAVTQHLHVCLLSSYFECLQDYICSQNPGIGNNSPKYIDKDRVGYADSQPCESLFKQSIERCLVRSMLKFVGDSSSSGFALR